MYVVFRNYSERVEFMYLLIRFSKTKSFLWNTKSNDKNGINEQSTHTLLREKENFRKG